MVTQKIEAKDKPFRVIHSNGDIIAGFDDLGSATEDAVARNIRAHALEQPGIRPTYSYSATTRS